MDKKGMKARYLVGIVGFIIIAWGYSMFIYPWNLILEIVGVVVLLVAIFNPLSLFGAQVATGIYKNGKELKAEGADRRTDVKVRSTVQGGSNHGQGSSHLAGNAYKQGDAKNRGSNYDNENRLLHND